MLGEYHERRKILNKQENLELAETSLEKKRFNIKCRSVPCIL